MTANTNAVVISAADFDRLTGLVNSRQGRVILGPLAAGLKRELGRGEIVGPTRVPRDVVTMNSKVRIRDLSGHDRETFTLVYPQDADINEGRLSVVAPLGTALLGARVGDVITVEAPAGTRRIKIERILYQPEAAGDFHL